MSAKPPREWMAFYVLHYLADTADLTFEQHGVYSMLLWVAWLRGGPLPDDPDLIRRALAAYVKGCGQRVYNSKVEPMLRRFFRLESGVWRNRRLELELESSRELSARAKRAADFRWGNANKNNGSSYADALRGQSASSPIQTYSINNLSSSSSARAKVPSFADSPITAGEALKLALGQLKGEA